MDLKDIRTVRDVIHETSVADLIILSLVLIPSLFGIWLITLNALDINILWKRTAFIILLAVYVIGVLVMKLYDPPEEKRRRAVLHVKNKLTKRSGHRASFEAIKKEVSKKYTDDFLKKLIELNPEIFSSVMIKKSNGESIPGITLIEDE